MERYIGAIMNSDTPNIGGFESDAVRTQFISKMSNLYYKLYDEKNPSYDELSESDCFERVVWPILEDIFKAHGGKIVPKNKGFIYTHPNDSVNEGTYFVPITEDDLIFIDIQTPPFTLKFDNVII